MCAGPRKSIFRHPGTRSTGTEQGFAAGIALVRSALPRQGTKAGSGQNSMAAGDNTLNLSRIKIRGHARLLLVENGKGKTVTGSLRPTTSAQCHGKEGSKNHGRTVPLQHLAEQSARGTTTAGRLTRLADAGNYPNH